MYILFFREKYAIRKKRRNVKWYQKHAHTQKKDFCIHFLFNIPFILNPLLYLCCGWTRSRKEKRVKLSLLFLAVFLLAILLKKRTPVVSEGGKWNCTSAYIKKHIVFLVYSPILHLHQKKTTRTGTKKTVYIFLVLMAA